MRKAMIGLLFVAAVAANADAQVKQSDSNIGIGSVSSGIGSGPGSGTYDVVITIKSHKRYGRKLHERGHKESYCKLSDILARHCGNNNFRDVDGIKLKRKSSHTHSGKFPASTSIYTIEGSLNSKTGTKWEWPAERHVEHAGQRWTYRDINLLRLKYENVSWNGWKINSMVRIKWTESDPGRIDDDSEWAYFNAGDMITKCLQNPLGSHTLLPKSSNYYWKLDSNGGLFGQYAIDVYYHVSCSSAKSGGGSSPPPTCDSNQCNRQCGGGGQCTSSGQCVCL